MCILYIVVLCVQGEADMFCRLLGHSRAEVGGWRSTEGAWDVERTGSWPIWIDFHEAGACSGRETRIEQCHDKTKWVHDGYCDHREDIVLSCQVRSHTLYIISQRKCIINHASV